MQAILLTIVLAPLVGAIIAGLFRNQVGRVGAHSVTILGVGISCLLSFYVLYLHAFAGAPVHNESVYVWMISDGLRMEIGFLVDNLTAMMMAVVTFVSLMVHIYTIGYMAHEEGYQRFFSYIALFTEHLYAFEIAAVILLVGIVAAIGLTMRRRPETKYQDPGRQVLVKAKDRLRVIKMDPES